MGTGPMFTGSPRAIFDDTAGPLRRAIPARAVIEVKVSKPGLLITVRQIRMRSGKGPKLAQRCLPPGAKRLEACP